MKKVLVVFFVTLLLAGCSDSPEKKAQKLIKQYLKENLNDPSSYQPVSFGELKDNGTSYRMEHKYRAKNIMGAVILEENTFDFDPELTRITFVY